MSHQRKISVIGLGYVGLPVAVAFGQQHPVIGFDIDAGRIEELGKGHDRTREVATGSFSGPGSTLPATRRSWRTRTFISWPCPRLSMPGGGRT